MFAVIHDGITVKDKDGNVYPGAENKRNGDKILVQYMDGEGITQFEHLPILEHGKRYIIEIEKGFYLTTFRADKFAFCNGACWSFNEVKGFSPLPEMIVI